MWGNRGSNWGGRVFSTALVVLLFSFSGSAVAAQKVAFSMEWVIYAEHAAFFVAKDLGYYSKAGMEVDIQRGFGSADVVKKLGAGSFSFGLPDVSEVIKGRANGLGIKTVAILIDRSSYVIISLEGSGIKKPSDLVGRTMGDLPTSSSRRMFPAVAASAGFDAKKVTWINVIPPAKVSSLIAGKVDAITTYENVLPPAVAAAHSAGKKLHVIPYRDWGVDTYSNGIATTDEIIRKDPNLVRRLVDASVKAMAWAAEHPTETVDILLKHNPVLNRKLSLETWEIMRGYTQHQAKKGPGIGQMTREKMRHTRDLVAKYIGIKKMVPVDEIFTNEFVPKVSLKK
jgi:NitT/TauT family transport system substrate-binding protein